MSGARPAVHRSTLIAATDWVLSAGWGTTPTKSLASGSSDLSGLLTIGSAGTGQAATPTATLTFKDGAFPQSPFAIVCRGSTGNQMSVPVTWLCTTTTLVVTFQGTPVAGETYQFSWMLAGGSIA